MQFEILNLVILLKCVLSEYTLYISKQLLGLQVWKGRQVPQKRLKTFLFGYLFCLR